MQQSDLTKELKQLIDSWTEDEELCKKRSDFEGARAFNLCKIQLETTIERHGVQRPLLIEQ